MKEWENDGRGVVGCEFGDLFEGPQEMIIERMELLPNIVFDMEFLSTDNKHTNSRTGLMIWEGARHLARLIAMNPELFRCTHVIELGSGACPLPSMVASYFGAKVVVTDGSIDVVLHARCNVARNLGLLNSDVECLQLEWGRMKQMDDVLQCFDCGVDWVLGADVLYSYDSVDLFFKTAKQLLRPSTRGRLLLCYMIRSVSASCIEACAATHDFFPDSYASNLFRTMEEKECESETLKVTLLSLRTTYAVVT